MKTIWYAAETLERCDASPNRLMHNMGLKVSILLLLCFGLSTVTSKTVHVKVTTYGYPDNDVGSVSGIGQGCYTDTIAHPHGTRQKAQEGDGSFNNPSTCAVSANNQYFPVESKIFIGSPYNRFCIVEDECASCDSDKWIDLWIGPNSDNFTPPLSSSMATAICGTAPGSDCNCDSGTCGTGGCESTWTSENSNIRAVANANADSGTPVLRQLYDWTTETCANPSS